MFGAVLENAKYVVGRVMARAGYEALARFGVGAKAAARLHPFDLALRTVHAMRKGDVLAVQVGAHDGVTNDPLRPYFVELGWRGVLVEPQPEVFAKLARNTESLPKIALEQAAIVDRDGPRTLYRFKAGSKLPYHATMLASLRREAVRFNGHGYMDAVEEVTVPGLSVATLAKRHRIERIDVLQVDAEGFDYAIIRMFLEAGFNPPLVHFEAAALSRGDRKDCIELLGERGYSVGFDGIDSLAWDPRKLVAS